MKIQKKKLLAPKPQKKFKDLLLFYRFVCMKRKTGNGSAANYLENNNFLQKKI